MDVVCHLLRTPQGGVLFRVFPDPRDPAMLLRFLLFGESANSQIPVTTIVGFLASRFCIMVFVGYLHVIGSVSCLFHGIFPVHTRKWKMENLPTLLENGSGNYLFHGNLPRTLYPRFSECQVNPGSLYFPWKSDRSSPKNTPAAKRAAYWSCLDRQCCFFSIHFTSRASSSD